MLKYVEVSGIKYEGSSVLDYEKYYPECVKLGKIGVSVNEDKALRPKHGCQPGTE